ncbi:MAG: SpvB/TcaC N-terminal domain-containing protein [Candidatus Omnitrophica bacterium]|nr:SpvB/TcaC N-terminal domain-containing protein [Candidatus Omnitrophota bacterium]
MPFKVRDTQRKTALLAVFLLFFTSCVSAFADDIEDAIGDYVPAAPQEARQQGGFDIDSSSGTYVVYWMRPETEIPARNPLYQLQESIDGAVWRTLTYTHDTFYNSASPKTAKSSYRYRVRIVSSIMALSYSSRWSLPSDGVVIDKTAPDIRQIYFANQGETHIEINWATSEAAGGVVHYGLTQDYGKTANGRPFTRSNSALLEGLTPGTLYHFKIVVTDLAGNTEESGDLTFRTNEPPDTAPPVVTSLLINNGAEYTNDRLVTLSIAANDDSGALAQMRISNHMGRSWSPDYDFKESWRWGLHPGDGQKNVSIKVSDKAGNWSEMLTQTIIFDTTPPITNTSFDSQPWHNADIAVDLTAADPTSGVSDTYYKVNNGPQRSVGVDGQPVITAEGANNRLEYWSVDNAGNEEAHHIIEGIKLDKTAPQITNLLDWLVTFLEETPTVSARCGDGLSGVNYGGIEMTLSVVGPLDRVEPSTEVVVPAVEGDIISYAPAEPLRFSIFYSIDLAISDFAGNISKIQWYFAILDRIVPVITGFSINSDAQYTNSIQVTLNIEARDDQTGLDQIQFSNDGDSWSVPESFARTKNWALASGDGVKTVYVRVSDNRAGQSDAWSDAVSKNIILDTAAPVTSTDFDASRAYYGVSLAIPLSTQDATSGVRDTYYIINNVDPGTPLSVAANGQPQITRESDNNILEYWSVDKAGNAEAHHTISGIKLFRSPPPDEPVETVEGRRVELFDGKVVIDIPQDTYERLGAEQRAQMRVQLLDKAAFEDKVPGYAVKTAIKFLPDGLQFSQPLTVTVVQHEVPGTPLELRYYNESSRVMETVQNLVVDSYGKASFQLGHFSTYAIIGNLTPPSTPVGASTMIPLPDMLTGSFSHSVPITVPPGRKGMQPNLTLQYRTTGSNSWAGMGWSLEPGYIVRDTRKGPARYDDSDTFVFRTQSSSTQLVHLTDNVWQAKIESTFTRFYKEADTWRSVEKNGTVMEFGATPESKENGSGGTFTWYVTKVKDTKANYVRFNYIKDKGKAYLNSVEYTGNDVAGFAPKHRVEFETEDRPDVTSSFISGEEISINKRLKRIRVLLDARLIWRYELEYVLSDDTSRSLLKSVTQYGSDGKSFPALTFNYQRATEN